jgi:hypothetical protein
MNDIRRIMVVPDLSPLRPVPFFVRTARLAQIWLAVFFRGILPRRSDPVSGRPWRVPRADPSWTGINRAFRTPPNSDRTFRRRIESCRTNILQLRVWCFLQEEIGGTEIHWREGKLCWQESCSFYWWRSYFP